MGGLPKGGSREAAQSTIITSKHVKTRDKPPFYHPRYISLCRKINGGFLRLCHQLFENDVTCPKGTSMTSHSPTTACSTSLCWSELKQPETTGCKSKTQPLSRFLSQTALKAYKRAD